MWIMMKLKAKMRKSKISEKLMFSNFSKNKMGFASFAAIRTGWCISGLLLIGGGVATISLGEAFEVKTISPPDPIEIVVIAAGPV